MNMPTLIVGAVVFGLIAAAVLKIVRDRRSGTSCGCGCQNCHQGRQGRGPWTRHGSGESERKHSPRG
jgi:hypothetical protein